MAKHKLAFIAFDTAKEKHAVAIADDGRDGEVRHLGEIDNSPDATVGFGLASMYPASDSSVVSRPARANIIRRRRE